MAWRRSSWVTVTGSVLALVGLASACTKEDANEQDPPLQPAAGDGGTSEGGSTSGMNGGAGAGVPQGGAAGDPGQSPGNDGGTGDGGTSDGGTGILGGGGAGAGTTDGGAGGGVDDPTCGDITQSCCGPSESWSCDSHLRCLGVGTACSCIAKLADDYAVRTDGAVLWESSVEYPILDADTAFPLVDALDVDGGTSHGCAAMKNGTVKCWRTQPGAGNENGQLGNGTTDAGGAILRATTVLTAANTPLTGVRAMASTNNNVSCAITGGGKLYCWGNLAWVVNGGAALSTGYAQAVTTDGATPLADVVQASTGNTVACAILDKGAKNELWCWGSNGAYDLGLGDLAVRQYPTKVPGLVNPSKVTAGSFSYNGASASCALDDGNVRCWGYNGYGQTGLNTAAGSTANPTLVKVEGGTPLTGATDLLEHGGGQCALHVTGTLWCWGRYYQVFAKSTGVANIVEGARPSGPFFLTSDGKYHIGQAARDVNCGLLE